MSASDETPFPPEIERLMGRWMDGDAAVAGEEGLQATPEAPSDDAGTMSQPDRIRAAQRQLVHALLQHLGDRETPARQARIEKAIVAFRQSAAEDLPQEAPAPAPSRRRLPRLVRWAVAASLLIAVASWLYLSSPNSALAALDRVVKAMDAPVDRTYEIAVEPADRPPPQPRPELHAGRDDQRPPQDRRPGLDGAILYTRGVDHFVLFRSTFHGELVINGSNGRQSWMIRPKHPVEVSDDLHEFRIPMPANLATIPFVDIRSTLESLRSGYHLEEPPAEALDDAPSLLCRHLRAQKIDPATKGPRAISIWFDPSTNQIRRIRFEQVNLQGRQQPRRLTISLASTQPLPANWFDPDAHRSSDVTSPHVTP